MKTKKTQIELQENFYFYHFGLMVHQVTFSTKTLCTSHVLILLSSPVLAPSGLVTDIPLKQSAGLKFNGRKTMEKKAFKGPNTEGSSFNSGRKKVLKKRK